MALQFVAASLQRLEVAASPISAYPFTMACWYRPTTTNVQYKPFYMSGGTNQHVGLAHTSAGLLFAERRNTTTVQAAGTAAISSNSWFHLAGVFLNDTSCTSYRNAVAGTTNTTSVTLPALTLVTVGALNNNGTVVSNCNGTVAEAAIWNVALDQAELTALAKGFPPFLIRPAALVFYAPLRSDASPSQELRGGQSLTWTGTPTLFPHGQLFGQAGKLWTPPYTAVAPIAADGTITATSTLSGTLSVVAPAVGTIAAASTVTSAATNTAGLAGAMVVSSTLTGNLGGIPLAGTIASTSTVTGTLTTRAVMAGQLAGQSTLACATSVRAPMAGNMTMASTLYGDLTSGGVTARAVSITTMDGPASRGITSDEVAVRVSTMG